VNWPFVYKPPDDENASKCAVRSRGVNRSPSLNKLSRLRTPWLQATLADEFSASGIGLHTGRNAHVVVKPAPAGTGLVLRRVSSGPAQDVAAVWTNWVPHFECTGVKGGLSESIHTIEHLLASLSVFGIDNALIEVDGNELPIFDGSAVSWCHAVLKAGVQEQEAPRRHLRILEPVEVREASGAWLRVEPADQFSISVTTYPPGFGLLSWDGEPTPWNFLCDIAPSRSHGPILGFPAKIYYAVTNQPRLRGVSHRTIALTFGGRYIGGMRVPDEPVRHRVLDLLGDLALTGAPLLGRVTGARPRHALNFKLVKAIMQASEAWELVALEPERHETSV
jgi:UDP-3-O-[3-hydroxymyristoyl] N-acetylglucosamine deacetylase